MLLGATSVSADKVMRVNFKDGGEWEILFNEKPKVTYTNNNLHVEAFHEATIPFDDIASFTFEDIDPVYVGDLQVAVEEVKAEKITEDILIYNTNGVLVKTVKQNKGTASILSSDLPKGVYVIKNGKTSFKITKR